MQLINVGVVLIKKNNNNRIKMASHTMQLAGKRKILQILQETNNSTPRDKNISNTHIRYADKETSLKPSY